ncbi:MAG TPA: hypothetical protein PLY79_11055, partial [Ferruginibacter sp.]|nr:hypothetical protein [Ferruginibacter sp.]
GSHTANIAGTLQTSTTGTFTLNTTNAVMNVYGTLTLGAGTNTNTGAIGTRVFHPGSICNINSNNINIPTATWDATSTLNINGLVGASSPTITSGQSFGNINWNSTGQTGTFNLFSTSSYTIQGTLTVTSTGTGKLRLSTSSTLTLNHIVVNGGTFELMNGAGTYTIGGNITQGGGSFDWNFASSSGTVNLAGNVTRTAGTMIKTGTTTGHFLVLNGTSAQTIDIPTTIVQSYRLNNTSGLNITGTLNINNNCTLDMRAGNILSGAVTYGATGTTLSYTGTTSQSATATEFPATGGPFNLTINNSGTAPNNVVTIPFDRSIGGTASGTVLNLTNGVLDNLGYTLTVLNTNTSAVTSVTSGGRYITGRLARVLPSSLTGTNTYVFPVGKTTNNAFELINPTTNAGGTVTIVAEAFDGATGGNPGNSLSAINNARYWSTSISDGAANFTDTRIRLNDTRGSYDVIGGSATLTGDYELVGGFPATLTSTSIASVAPAVSSLGYYLMANPASPEISDITIDPATPQCTNVARTITATVEEGGAALTLVEIRYQVNGGSVQNVAMTNTSGDTWEGVIPTVTPANGTVTWSIYAEDAAALSKSEAGPSYKDEPLFGAVATANATPSTVCAGADVSLTASFTGIPTAGQTGPGAGTSSLAGVSPYYHGYGGAKTQYIITASELSAIGMVAGNISSLSFEISSLGTSTLNGFAISMGHTGQSTAVSNAPITTGLTQVYASAAQTLTSGVNNYVFTTPFAWDGTSNIVISVCYSNNNSGGSSSTVRTDGISYVGSLAVYADNATSAAVCAATSSIGLGSLSSNTTTSTRPKMVFTGTAVPPLYTLEWNDGTNPVGTTSPLVVNPTTTTSYTVEATFTASGCTLTSSPVAVTVNPIPAGPTSAVGSTQCGLGVPNAFVTGGLPGQFRWYLQSTGGTALPGEVNQQLDNYSINTTTTFYVAIYDGTCESTRVPVTATVNPPDAVDATVVSNTVCVNSPLDLTAVQTGSNQTYTYTWTAVPEAGSGITGSVTGDVVNITPTVAGTYTYTVTAVDGGCTTTDDVVVTVVDLPLITSATATPATICNGGSSTLTATSVFSNAVTATLGTGTINNLATSTGASGYPAPFGNYYEGAKNQFLIKASELTAAGLSAGNLNSLAFDVVTPEVEPLQDFTIGMKQTTLSALSTMETGFTTVYSNASYVPSATGGFDNNTIIFDTPFAWDGTSDIVIETCFNNDDFTSNAVFNQSTTAYVSSLVYRADGISGLCSSTSLSFSYSQRPNMRLQGGSTTDLTSSLTWEWNPGALSGNSVSVSPTATETYTVSATDANGCVNTTTVEVTVNELPDAPIGLDSEHCGTLVPTAEVTTGGANGSGVFNWYDAPTGGNLLQTGTDATYLTAISQSTTFYVSETGTNGCESERTPVNVTVIEADPLTLTADAVTSACVGAEITLEVTQGGGNNTYEFTYSADPDAGSGITGSETGTLVSVYPTAAGTYTYTVTGIDNDKGCTNVATAIIT